MGIFFRFIFFIFAFIFSFSSAHSAERNGIRTDFDSPGVRLIVGETLEVLKGNMEVRPFSSLDDVSAVSPLSRSLSPSPFWVIVTLVNDGDRSRDFVIDSGFRDFIFGSSSWPLRYPEPGILQGFFVDFSESSETSTELDVPSGVSVDSPFRPLLRRDDGVFLARLSPGTVKDIVLELRGSPISERITVWHEDGYNALEGRFFAFEVFLLGSMAILFLSLLFFSFSSFERIYIGLILLFFGSVCFILGEFGYIRRFFWWAFSSPDYSLNFSFLVSYFRLIGDIFLLSGVSTIFYYCSGGSHSGIFYRRLFLLYIFILLSFLPLGWFWVDPSGLSVRLLLGISCILMLGICVFMCFRGVSLWRNFLLFWCLFPFWYLLSYAGSFWGYAHMFSSFIPSGGLVILTGVGIWSCVLNSFHRVPLHRHFFDLGGRRVLALLSSGHHIWDWHVRNDSLYVGSDLETSLGLSSGYLSSGGWQSWLSLIHIGDRSNFILCLEDSHHDGRIFECRLRLHHSDGRWVWYLLRGRVIKDDLGNSERVIGLMSDFSSQALEEDRLLRHCVSDGMSGLPRRILFEHLLDHTLSHNFEVSGSRLYVLSMTVYLDRCASGFVDLDNLREGLFVSLCEEIRKCLGSSVVLSRFSRRCFVAFRFFGSDDEAESFGTDICLGANSLFVRSALPLRLSIGISSFSAGAVCDSSRLIDLSFSALHLAQIEDRGVVLRILDDTPDLIASNSRGSSLSASLENSTIDLRWLALVSPSDFSFLGCSGSLFWQDGDDIILHNSLFEMADSFDLSHDLGGYFLDLSVRYLGSWQRSFQSDRVPFMILPLPSSRLFNYDLVSKISALLPHEEILPGSLYIEVSELTILLNPDYAGHIFSRLRDLGIGIVCGDYRGHILEYLPSLPIDILHFSDCLFATDKRSHLVLASTISLSHSLNMRVMYGSVSVSSERDILVSLGCDYIGGSYFGELLSEHDLSSLIGNESLSSFDKGEDFSSSPSHFHRKEGFISG